ncbi:MAG: hypothetical protein EZS28_027268 [Streblomastix strix]|uniref:Tyr recombinase domain-containing protein n=1 Tax=Streblomastix strix TaxID=222440 RepID=A0A5J4V536_9EUKA|nr:MAG: hypothetical protein EZS28_027268 [Streblomastix strix]
MNIINSLSPETQHKRRAGMHLFNNYLKEKQVPMEQIVLKKADVLLSNALTWRELQGGNHMLEDLRKMKTHVGMVLSMFSSQDNVGQSPIIIELSKRLKLDREQKSKYAVILNLQMLLDYVRRTGLGSGRQLMRSTMTFVVAFSGCRMTELSSMRRNDITQEAIRTVIQTKVKKGKKVRTFEIIFKKKDDICCAAKAIELWLIDKNCTKRNDVGIWWDFEKKRTLGCVGCSKELKIIITDVVVSKKYAGSTIRHLMMTDLRSKEATKVEVNEFTRHAPS